MANSILFYISGHGFGHARRSCRILEALKRREPTLDARVRSNAARGIFHSIGLEDKHIQGSGIDVAIVEKDAFTIDDQASANNAIELWQRRRAVMEEEIAGVRAIAPRLIISDVPFLAGEVAERLGVPCVASGNFTWDWIFEPMLRNQAGGAEVLAWMSEGYRKMAGVLRHPFSHEMGQFREVWDISAVAYRGRERDLILEELNFEAAESRPRILLAMRGGMRRETVAAGVRDCPDCLFSILDEVPEELPNLRRISRGSLDFAEIMSAHDVVISKLGSGLVCDALAAKTRLLWPRRSGFREDELFDPAAAEYLNMQEIPREDFLAGRWRGWIERLLGQALPSKEKKINGAQEAVEKIVAMLS